MKTGFIKITDILYQQNWEEISIIFREFRPSHIEFRHWENDIWYFWGTCNKFDELKEAEQTPEYTVVLTRIDGGDIEYKFERV